ncbi:MAG: poly-beta-1,6-N-acetyl-D-glucosamine N-deacetylase PgaB [Candidatus Methylumidiphilus sp.]
MIESPSYPWPTPARIKARLAWGVALLWLAVAALAQAQDGFIALSYHDVKDAVARDASAGQTAVSVENLKLQFAWLRQQGYRVVGVDELLAARAGRKPLPNKAVLLTFDDGYASFHSKVLPLLRQYHYPALLAIVGAWLDDGPRPAEAPPREALLTWAQVAALSRSGLVEIASHSDGLHQGILGNPQGNPQPAGTTRAYDPRTGRYESDTAYARRIGLEMRAAAATLARHTGKPPRVMVWPYGEANRPLLDAAAAVGMTVTFGLRDGGDRLADLPYAGRLLVTDNPGIDDFARLLTGLRRGDRPLHVVHVDMDYLYDPDPAQTERNLGRLLDRIQSMRVNTVYLQAFADPDGDGNADALYFPNRHLPMRADLFNRVAWQLRTRAGVKVYAWMPVLALQIKAPENWFVQEWHDGKVQKASHIYHRLSPFNRKARQVVGEIYQDLAKHCHFSGLLFHDDAILSDYEDVGAQALKVVAERWHLPTAERQLRVPADMRMRWAKHKTQALIDWTDYLTAQVREYRPDIKTARNYYALPLLQPDSEEWYAQSLPTGLQHYDYVAVEAMPLMEKAENPDRWLEELVKKVAAQPQGLAKTVFELQTVDWNTQTKIPMDVFLRQLRLVQQLGGIHLGYYPDNVYDDHPRLEDMEHAFALPSFP